jgi:hypothetical protein
VTTFSPYSAYPSPEREVPFQAGPPPVLVAVADRAPQRRLTVFFRLIMLIPHFIVLFFLAIAAEVVAFLGWWGALFTGRLPEFAHTFLSGVMRWTVRVYAYGMLLTDVYPPFSLEDDPDYPVRIAVPPRQQLNRLAVFFRFILFIPVALLGGILAYGAGTVLAFVAWLITLVAGRLPESFHLAYSAVLRFQARYYGYVFMLTPAYPGRLFGDVPGTPTWADAAGAAPVAPGFGTPESVYGGPTAQDAPAFPAAPADPSGYGYPAQPDYPAQAGYSTEPGYPAQPGYAEPPTVPPGYPGQQGYGYPAQQGYGYPAPAQAVAQPAGWLIVLSAGARRLLVAIIVLGVLTYGGTFAVRLASAKSANNVETAQTALDQTNASYTTLTNQLTSWESAVSACDGNLTCVTGQDAKAAGYFTTFDSKLTGTAMPSNSVAAAARLNQVSNAAASDFTQLSKVTTASQYQSVVTSSGLQTTLNNFDSDYTALVNALESN